MRVRSTSVLGLLLVTCLAVPGVLHPRGTGALASRDADTAQPIPCIDDAFSPSSDPCYAPADKAYAEAQYSTSVVPPGAAMALAAANVKQATVMASITIEEGETTTTDLSQFHLQEIRLIQGRAVGPVTSPPTDAPQLIGILYHPSS